MTEDAKQTYSINYLMQDILDLEETIQENCDRILKKIERLREELENEKI